MRRPTKTSRVNRLMRQAMRHPDVPGAGAAKRRKLGLKGREKSAVVMKEFYHGTLRSRSGAPVTDVQQAKAIAMSEGRAAEGLKLSRKTKEHWHNPTSSKPIDEHAVTELRLYAENESAIYPQHQAIIASIKRKMRAGKYDPHKAPKAWLYWVDAAAKRYVREFGGDLKITFPKVVRMAVADEVARDEAERIRTGDYGEDWKPVAKAAKRPTKTGHHSPYTVVYGGHPQGPYLTEKAFGSSAEMNRQLIKHGLRLWDTGIPTQAKAFLEAKRAARRHGGTAVVYDESTGSVVRAEPHVVGQDAWKLR